MEYEKNIILWYNLATKKDIKEGLKWYGKARVIADEIAEKYNLFIENVIGIISALSPRCKWDRNIIDAVSIIENGENAIVTTFNHNKEKAIEILNGRNPRRAIKANKTRNFFFNIKNYKDKRYVTIDTHAISVAVNKRVGKPEAQKLVRDYDNIKQSYINVSQELDIYPSQLQAITWITFRKEFKIT